MRVIFLHENNARGKGSKCPSLPSGLSHVHFFFKKRNVLVKLNGIHKETRNYDMFTLRTVFLVSLVLNHMAKIAQPK